MTDDQAIRSLVMHAIGELAVERIPARPLGPGQVRIAVHAVGYCKSDVLGYLGGNDRRQRAIDDGGPLVMGHEAVGHVVELGPGVEGPAVGTPVVIDPIIACGVCEACRADAGNACLNRRIVGCDAEWPGAYAESLVIPAENAVPFVGVAPLEWGALVEPLSVGAHALNLAGDVADRRVLVLGGGIIGTGVALQAERRGVREVTVSERLAERRALLAGLGLTAVPPDEAGGGYDVVVDCVAVSETLTQAIEALRRRGTLVVVGVAGPTAEIPVMRMVENEQTLRGSFACTKAELAAVVAWVAAGERDLGDLVEAQVGWGRAVAAFERYREPSPPFRTALLPRSD
ncbi:MAG: alcohol dehydrogenase catalytic domain-containing protein [Patulibacter sp.]|nr:alcohol dehydrogenase catalytic domain-containing protein [Patulibacter sp.]